jgi:predicted branched-subunit amino acid permease
MAFGAMCAQKRFSLPEVEIMMATVYGGLSQFVAVQSWPDLL